MQQDIVIVVAGGEPSLACRRSARRRAGGRGRRRASTGARARAARRRRVGDFDSVSAAALAAAEAAGARIDAAPDGEGRDRPRARARRGGRARRRAGSSWSARGGGRLDHLLGRPAAARGGALRRASRSMPSLGTARCTSSGASGALEGEPRRARLAARRCTGRPRASRPTGSPTRCAGETLAPGLEPRRLERLRGSRRRASRSSAASCSCVRPEGRETARVDDGARGDVLVALASRRRRLRLGEATADRGRARHARLVRGLEGGEGRVRARDGAEAADPPGGRRRRGAQPRAADGGQPAGRRPLRRRQQPALAGARRRACSSRTSRRSSTHVDRAYVLDAEHRVTPIDHGEVCLNVDRGWFAARGIAPPRDARRARRCRATAGCSWSRTRPPRRPGLAFLLATVARYGESGWQDYWRRLRANDVLVVDGWEEAYTARFSGAAGSKGKRPIVVSYASSPPAEVIFAGKPLDAGADRGVESTVLPSGRARRRPARREQRGGRAGADRLHALAAVPGATCPDRCSSSRCATASRCRRRSEVRGPSAERPLELAPDEIGRNRDALDRRVDAIVLR